MENGKQSVYPLEGNKSRDPLLLGLTKREYFAGLAMQGMLSNNLIIDSDNWYWIAENSIKQADELLKLLSND